MKTTLTPTALFVAEAYRSEFDTCFTKYFSNMAKKTRPCVARLDFLEDAEEMKECLMHHGVPQNAITLSLIETLNIVLTK